MQVYELTPMYDNRASFYGKAHVIEQYSDDGKVVITLRSYSTDVARINEDGSAKVYGTYSQTTLRHIKEFLKQNGFKAENSKQIMADYGSKAELADRLVEAK